MQHLLHVKTLAEDEFATLASEMLKGIHHLHTIGLVHREAEQRLHPYFAESEPQAARAA